MQRIFRLNPKKLIGKYLGIRLSWMVRNRKFILFISLFSGIIAALIAFLFLRKIILFTLPLGVLAALYVLPFYKKQSTYKAIRHFPFAKITAVSTVWASTAVLLPVILAQGINIILTPQVILLFIGQFLFIYAITLPFDVRDLKYDLSFNMRTIPSKIGVTKTIRLIYLLLAMVAMVKFYEYHLDLISLFQLISLLIALGITALITSFTSIKRSELFYSGLVEGTMVILYFSVLLLEY